jgi:hypothetical protein
MGGETLTCATVFTIDEGEKKATATRAKPTRNPKEGRMRNTMSGNGFSANFIVEGVAVARKVALPSWFIYHPMEPWNRVSQML